MTSFLVVIPARYQSTRLPGKPLLQIAGKPLLQHVVDRAQESAAERVIVATDDARICEAMQAIGTEVCMTGASHQSGTERLSEVVELLGLSDDVIIVNVQGDEPMIPPQLIDSVALRLAAEQQAVMATAAQPINSQTDLQDANVVKVVVNQRREALYFSRAPIPYDGDSTDATPRALHHIGIYAYRAKFLRRFPELPQSQLERMERLEQLRVLDHGETIVVETVDYDAGIGVDTPEDLERVRKLVEQAES